MDPVNFLLASVAPSTRRVILSDLRSLSLTVFPGDGRPVADLPWETLTPEQAVAARAAQEASVAPGTADRRVTHLRGVVRASWRTGAITWEAHRRLLDTLTPVRGGRVTRGRALEWHQLRRLLAAVAGPEEQALLAVLAGAGCRRAEAASLTWDRVTRHDQTWFLRVLGKGNKERRVRLPSWAAGALRRWRRACPEREYLFRWRTGEAVYRTVRRVTDPLGIGRVSPHDLRRTMATLFLSHGGGYGPLQRTMGHASITTTVKYDKRTEEQDHLEMARLDALGPESVLDTDPGDVVHVPKKKERL
jgi:integrase